MRLRFRTKLLASYLVLVAAVEVVALIVVDLSLRADLVSRLDDRLTAQARGVAEWINEGGRHPERLAGRLERVVGARVTMFDRFGVVLGDSDTSVVRGRGEAAPAEVQDARDRSVGFATRDGHRFVAVLAAGGAVVRLAAPMGQIDDTLAALRWKLGLAGLVGLLAALALSLLASRLIAAPLRVMRDSAASIARGDYHVPRPKPAEVTSDEFGTLEHALGELATQLEHLETMRRDFVANLSHEIGTPVAAIQNSAETLQTGRADAAETREFLDVIERHAKRIAHLTRDLLRLAEIEGHRPGSVSPEQVAVAAIAGEVARTARHRAEERGARVVVSVDPALHVLADPMGLEQILENLVDNAIKYGKPNGEVTVTGAARGERVVITVSDDGPGIAAVHLPRLFERFYRVDPGRARERGGTGLGLAIVKHLTEAMGGSVSVASTLGTGTTFTVELPGPPPEHRRRAEEPRRQAS